MAVAPLLCAQVSLHVSPDQAAKLQVPQPGADVTSPVTVTATFDPPNARVGQTVYYRVVLDGAGGDVEWPGAISAPKELTLGPVVHGQLVQFLGNKFRPLATYLYEVHAMAAGQFTIPAFEVMEVGKVVQIPPATLDVDNTVSGPTPRTLVLDVSVSNVYVGQSFRARVILPASPPQNQIEALREVEFNGDGLMSDLSTMRQAIENVVMNGHPVPVFDYELTLTPIKAGPVTLSAQAFAAGHEFFAPITITAPVNISGGPPQYVLLVSNPVHVNVNPLPAADKPADFNGAIGTFTLSAPQLSTNRLEVGQAVRLTVAVHTSGPLDRLAPPEPPSADDWQIIPDRPPDFSFTLIPQNDSVRQTPAIPFSYFDPKSGNYVDATIPSLPVTVTSEGLPTVMPAADAGSMPGEPLKLGGLSPIPGRSVASLVPQQLRSGFVGFQIVPIFLILGLWRWDRHRRFLEAHPDIVRRRQARRLLRREKRRLRGAARRGDEVGIVRHAADAMKIASAPHDAAHPQALVCSDVLKHLDDADRSGAAGETVRKVFAAADARFALAPQIRSDWAGLESDVNAVLMKLEEQL